MRVLGLDPSSSKSGIALVVDGVPELLDVWKGKTNDSQMTKLIQWADQVRAVLTFARPDLVVIEECGPHRNPQTFRALVRFEAVASYEVKRAGMILILHKVSEARKIVMGKGNAPKEEVFREMKRRYPDFEWRHVDKGGDDQSDALAMALAGPQLAERR